MICLGKKSSVRLLCPFDGLPCGGPIIAGGPSCFVSAFGVVGDEDLHVCPRLKSRK